MPANRVTSESPWHVVFVVDDSNSMAGQPALDVTDGFKAMLAEFEIVAKGVKPYFRVSVIAFGSTASVLVECKGEREIDVGQISQFVGSRGSSAAELGLRAAINILRKHPGKATDFRPYVFLFSSGKIDRPDAAVAVADELKRLDIPAGRPSVISIGLGDTAADVMRLIASTEELFVHLKTSSDLIRLFPSMGTVAGTKAGSATQPWQDSYIPPTPETFYGQKVSSEIPKPATNNRFTPRRLDIPVDHRGGLLPGTMIGVMRIEREIERSEICIVYLAINETNGRSHLLREYFPEHLAQRATGEKAVTWRRVRWFGPQKRRLQNLRRAFLKELELGPLLQHQNLLLPLDKLAANSTLYTIRDAGEGTSLDEMRRRRSRPFGAPEVAATFKHLLGILAFIHSKRVVHGKISPLSILVSPRRYPIICDFSEAVRLSDVELVVPFSSSGFAAPELVDINGRSRPGYLGPWCDLYGLAGTMYFCFAGEQPKGGSLQRYVDELIEKYKVPWRFASAIGVCMATDFDRRPGAATEVLRLFDVDEFGTGVREEPLSEEPLDPINPAILNL